MGMSAKDAAAFAHLWDRHGGSTTLVALELGIDQSNVRRRRRAAEAALGAILPSSQSREAVRPSSLSTEDRIELMQLRKASEETQRLHDLFAGALAHIPSPPHWTINARLKAKGLGVPSLFLSDLHWGENVDPKQINGVNEYSLEIAHRRLRRVFDTALLMLMQHLYPHDYPGMALILGGDMVSGNIHEELRETNDASILAIVLDLFDHLVAGIDMLLANGIPHLFIPCVVGNHGRLDKKPRAKGAVQDNYEWILYQLLLRHYASDRRVTVIPSDSLDYVYRLFNTTYLLTHGDQFRGGAGIAGPFTPWALGDHKKRKRQNAIQQPYDYMIFGHFHTLVWGPSWIVNGTLKGYDEYSFRSNFGFEVPQQALWITHPKHGITVKLEIQAEDRAEVADVPWVRVRGS